MSSHKMSAAETKVELLDRMRTEGVTTAFETALSVLRDPKAAAPAKATVITTVFRAAGYLKEGADDGVPDFSKMSRPELERFLSVATKELESVEKSLADRRCQIDVEVVDDADDVFA